MSKLKHGEEGDFRSTFQYIGDQMERAGSGAASRLHLNLAFKVIARNPGAGSHDFEVHRAELKHKTVHLFVGPYEGVISNGTKTGEDLMALYNLAFHPEALVRQFSTRSTSVEAHRARMASEPVHRRTLIPPPCDLADLEKELHTSVLSLPECGGVLAGLLSAAFTARNTADMIDREALRDVIKHSIFLNPMYPWQPQRVRRFMDGLVDRGWLTRLGKENGVEVYGFTRLTGALIGQPEHPALIGPEDPTVKPLPVSPSSPPPVAATTNPTPGGWEASTDPEADRLLLDLIASRKARIAELQAAIDGREDEVSKLLAQADQLRAALEADRTEISAKQMSIDALLLRLPEGLRASA